MSRNIVASISFAEGGMIFEFTRVSDMRQPAFAMNRQLQVPETPELADMMDQLTLDAERLLSRALEEFSMAEPHPEFEFEEDEDEEVEVSPWDNPEERDLAEAERPPRPGRPGGPAQVG